MARQQGSGKRGQARTMGLVCPPAMQAAGRTVPYLMPTGVVWKREKRTNDVWPTILVEAARLANGLIAQGIGVTLRQLHYLLVSLALGGYANVEADYNMLSEKTSEARRDGAFPPLTDLTRGVQRLRAFKNPDEAVRWLKRIYRVERMDGQEYQFWILYEKATLIGQMKQWIDNLGIKHAAMRGYSSESLEREIWEAMEEDGRSVVCGYVGDLDPEGEDIERNFLEQAARRGIDFDVWERLGVLPAQVPPRNRRNPGGLGLLMNPGKPTSSRAPAFTAKYGQLFQIEVEAIDPRVLKQLVLDFIARLWDDDVYGEQLEREQEQEDQIEEIWDAGLDALGISF